MKLVEKVIKENLTWKQAIREMNEEYSYVIKSGSDNVVFLTNEKGELFIIDSKLERIYPIPHISDFTIHMYSTVKVTDEALKLIKAELY